ncbi:MAG: hypothetical protein ABSE69_20815 [Roseiarcus sp.]|jgi:hypothetical protein
MRGWPAHVVFATILMGSLAAQERAADVLVESGSLEPAVLRVARSQGLAFREYTTITDANIRALVFEAPGCSRPVLVIVRFVTFEEEPILRSTPEQGYVRRYVYIERTWDKPDRLAVLAQRVKYGMLAMFGLTRYAPSWHLLQIEAPSDCQSAGTIDWRLVWNRADLTAARPRPDISAYKRPL